MTQDLSRSTQPSHLNEQLRCMLLWFSGPEYWPSEFTVSPTSGSQWAALAWGGRGTASQMAHPGLSGSQFCLLWCEHFRREKKPPTMSDFGLE